MGCSGVDSSSEKVRHSLFANLVVVVGFRTVVGFVLQGPTHMSHPRDTYTSGIQRDTSGISSYNTLFTKRVHAK